jgi:hypothetical protein
VPISQTEGVPIPPALDRIPNSFEREGWVIVPILAAGPDQISSQWLTNRLCRNEHLPKGEVVSVNIKARHKHHFALEVDYSDDAPGFLPRDFILKWYSDRYGIREGVFFDEIVPAMNAPPVPPCYDVNVDWKTGQTHILLKDLSATHYVPSPPYRSLGREEFERVVRAYVEIHAHWWDPPQIGQREILRYAGIGVSHEAISPQTIRENERYFAEEVLPARVDELGDQFPAEWQRLCERVIRSWAGLFIQRITGMAGLTLIQGDAQLGNVLLPRAPQLNRPVIIDWEGCTWGLGVWDLTRTLIQTEFSSGERTELEGILLHHYQAWLEERGIVDYNIEDCLFDYRLCVLANTPHALVWESHSYLESAMRALRDWECAELLD